MLKPATVLYGGSLPKEFFEEMENLEADLFFVCGTSLGVAPANYTVMHANNYRVLCNREKVG